MALVDVRRAYFYARHEEEYSSNCRWKITGQVTNTCACCCSVRPALRSCVSCSIEVEGQNTTE